MGKYHIVNRITKDCWDGEAESAQEACQRAGWLIGNCWVRKYPPKGSEDEEEAKRAFNERLASAERAFLRGAELAKSTCDEALNLNCKAYQEEQALAGRAYEEALWDCSHRDSR